MNADLKTRIREHLATAMSPDNLTSTREKYEQALALLREVVSAKASAKAGAPHSVPVAKMTAKWRRKG